MMSDEMNNTIFDEFNGEKFDVLYVDPPWSFSSKKTGGTMKSGSDQIYGSMTLDELKALPVDKIAADNCLLVMWYVGAMPQEAIDLVNAWGFTLKNMNGFMWNKLTKHGKPFFGMGHLTRAGSESAIFAVKGKFKPDSKGVRAVREEIVGRHSEKPAVFHDDIEKLAGKDKKLIELFARRAYPGWATWGNQSPDE